MVIESFQLIEMKMNFFGVLSGMSLERKWGCPPGERGAGGIGYS
jgi:hypothetical protein